MRFENYLEQYSSQQDPIIVVEQGSYLHDHLAPDGSGGRSTLPEGIAVSAINPAFLVKALAFLDGYIDRILLLSPYTSPELVSSLCEKAGISEVMSDRDDLPSARTFSELDTLARPSLRDTETSWLLATSGTTNEPKLVRHTLTSLTRTIVQRKVGGNFIWGQLYDCHRFAGMQVLLQSLCGGSKLVSPDLAAPLKKRLSLFAKEHVNAISATPTMWRKIVSGNDIEKLPLTVITLGGEISDDVILSTLSKLFPDAKIRHIYASTEAGTGFSVTDAKAGFPVEYLENGYKGIEMKVVDSILFIENPHVSGKYFGSESKFGDDDKFVNTGDRVNVDGDRVYFLGRASGVINVGGDKVFPETIEKTLNAVQGVKLSRIYGKKSAFTGELVIANIAIESGADESEIKDRLTKVCNSQLERYQRPTMFIFVDEIPVSENGKVVRT
jgi:acyl-CoA synthetase (AMP-forming)/AMP-acid ligase II